MFEKFKARNADSYFASDAVPLISRVNTPPASVLALVKPLSSVPTVMVSPL